MLEQLNLSILSSAILNSGLQYNFCAQKDPDLSYAVFFLFSPPHTSSFSLLLNYTEKKKSKRNCNNPKSVRILDYKKKKKEQLGTESLRAE